MTKGGSSGSKDPRVAHMSQGFRGGGVQAGKDKNLKAGRMHEAASFRGAAAQHEAHQWAKHREELGPLTPKQMEKMLAQQAATTADPLTMLVLWTMMSRR